MHIENEDNKRHLSSLKDELSNVNDTNQSIKVDNDKLVKILNDVQMEYEVIKREKSDIEINMKDTKGEIERMNNMIGDVFKFHIKFIEDKLQ